MAINDPFMDLDYLIYQLKYDSVHGKFCFRVKEIYKADSLDRSRRLKAASL